MSRSAGPYNGLPERAFWRRAVARNHHSEIDGLWDPAFVRPTDRIATAGSCFAQHLGHRLAACGARFMDLEPAPGFFGSVADARRWGYGLFTCRTGNIYTSRQLVQLYDEAHGLRVPVERVWERGGRHHDALRPSVDPVGHESAETVLALRDRHLAAVRTMFAELDVFIFTMGLTEGWEHRDDETMFPVSPGTVAGAFDPERHALRTLRHHEILADMIEFRARLRDINRSARMVLTVSPVSMAATATDEHVLVANTYSKSVLRSVAGELAADIDDIAYFPGYELVAAHPSRGSWYEPDLRHVSNAGVDHVMSHFLPGRAAAHPTGAAAVRDSVPPAVAEHYDPICDEDDLDGDA